MLDSLFRREATDAYYERWLGEPRVRYSLSAWSFILIGIVAIVLLFAVVFFGTYARRTVISGVVVPQAAPVNLTSPVTGRIISILFHKGDLARPWQALFVVDPKDQDAAAIGPVLDPSSSRGAPGVGMRSVVVPVDMDREGKPGTVPMAAVEAPALFSHRVPVALVMMSTVGGIVGQVTASRGQLVTSGQILARMLPVNTRLVARAFASPDQVPVLQQGDVIPLRLSSADDHGLLFGKIISIVAVPAPYPVANSAPLPQVIAYAIDIEIPRSVDLPGRAPLILMEGMHFSSSLFSERRPIYRWMFPSLTQKIR